MKLSELIKLVEDLVQLPAETEWIEFKVNYTQPESIGEYISALANSACLHHKNAGYLIFGVEDVSHNIVGTLFRPQKTKVGGNELENWLSVHFNPRIDFRIFEFDYQEKHIVIFKIDPTYNTPIRFKNTAYIRVGSITKKLKEYPEKERKIWKTAPEIAFEEKIALQDINDDEVLKLLDYPSYFDLMGLNLPPNKNTILQKLTEERLIKKIGERDKYQVTNLGAILFAKNLGDFGRLFRKALRVIIYKGNDRTKTIREKEIKQGYATGFDSIIEYINSQLPANEEIGKVFRETVKMYPDEAIRELVANAIIHQDFHKTGTGPMVEVFDNRVEITNPGGPLIDTLRFIDHNPESRNENLASFMRRINICEERGSGIDKVVKAVELYQLPAPLFIGKKEEDFLRVILHAHKTFKQMDKEDRIRSCYQHCVLKYISGELMTNQSIRKRFNIEEKNYPMASRIISDTIEKGLIKDSDPESKSKKFAKYIPFWV